MQENLFINIKSTSNKKSTINIVHKGDPNFHYKLLTIKPKIKLISYKGNYELLNKQILGIVGPRKMTSYSQKVLQKLFEIAQKYKICIISGGANGVDQLSHNIAMEKNMPTIVVLGMGIGNALHGTKRNFLEKILQNKGLILSEYEAFEPSSQYSFPERNRIIAGLSDCIFIPEAQENSGSLITADFAHKIQKPVYGTPNDIFESKSQGLHKYIQSNKIKPIFDFEEMLQKHFSQTFFQTPQQKFTQITKNTHLSEEEKIIINTITTIPNISINLLIQKTNMNISELLTNLTHLQLKNIIYQTEPGTYNIK